MKKKLRGFKNVAADIARREGIPMERANRVLAGATRKASASAKRKNPNLYKVKGGYR